MGAKGAIHPRQPYLVLTQRITEWRDNRLSTRQVSECFGVAPTTVSHWVRQGQVTPVARVSKDGKWCYFSRREIEQRLRDWITIEEAAAILGVHRATVESWCKSGKLIPVSRGIKGRIWLDRTEIVQLSEQKQPRIAGM